MNYTIFLLTFKEARIQFHINVMVRINERLMIMRKKQNNFDRIRFNSLLLDQRNVVAPFMLR